MLTPKEQRAMARTLRVLRREERRAQFDTDHNLVRTALRAEDAKAALVRYLITAKHHGDDQDAAAVLEDDQEAPTAPEPAKLRPVD